MGIVTEDGVWDDLSGPCSKWEAASTPRWCWVCPVREEKEPSASTLTKPGKIRDSQTSRWPVKQSRIPRIGSISSVTKHLWGTPWKPTPTLWEPPRTPSLQVPGRDIHSGKKHVNGTQAATQKNCTQHWLRVWLVTYRVLLSTYNFREVPNWKLRLNASFRVPQWGSALNPSWFAHCLIHFQQQPQVKRLSEPPGVIFLNSFHLTEAVLNSSYVPGSVWGPRKKEISVCGVGGVLTLQSLHSSKALSINSELHLAH